MAYASELEHNSIETLIDPFNETISIVQAKTANGRYQGYNELIGSSIFTVVRLYENGDAAYIDDEGLYKEDQYFWMHRNYPSPLCGRGVFLGVDEHGDVIPPQTSLTQLNKDVVFIGSRYHLVLHIRKNGEIENEDYRPIFFTEA